DFLVALARQHRLEIITIEDLIRYRRAREKLVERQEVCEMPTRYGPATFIYYGVKYESQEPFALVFGTPTTVAAPLVRIHSSCLTGDLLYSLRCDCGDQLHMALEL